MRSVFEYRISIKTGVVNDELQEVGLLGKKRVFYNRRKNLIRSAEKNHENI